MPSARQKRKFRRFVFYLMAATLFIVGGIMFYQWITYRKAQFTTYPEFGIAIPESYDIHGIDVSKYQSVIAWEQVKAMQVDNIRLSFSFIKATEGIGNTDPRFRKNWKQAKEAGIYRGAYHFFIASKDGRLQAEHFIRQVRLETGDLPPVLDIEQVNGTSTGMIQREAKEWLNIVEEYYGVKPVIYTNVDFYNRYLGEAFDDYPLWVAHYYQRKQPRIKRGWIFWQHSDEGRVNGIKSPVDFNVFNGDSTEFRSLLIKR